MKQSNKNKIEVLFIISAIFFSFGLNLQSQKINSAKGAMDLAKGRVFINEVEYRNNPPGTYCFKVFIDLRFARNCQDYPGSTDRGPAYTDDSLYQEDPMDPTTISSDYLNGNDDDDDDDDDSTENHYSAYSYFRRGTTSSADGIEIQIRIKWYGYWFGYNVEGSQTIFYYDWYDYNSDQSFVTDWFYDNKIKVHFNIDISTT